LLDYQQISMPDRNTLVWFLDWVQGIGFWGAVLFAAAYVPAAVLFVPGAATAFLVARTVARDWVLRRISGRPKLAAIGRAVEKEDFKLVLLTRLSPVLPFNVLNYAFGLTRARFGRYLLASWIGMLPGTVMYVYLGSAANSVASILSEETPRSTGQQVLFALGLGATVAAVVVVTRAARRALDEMVAEP
jgi:uncharacterized membrane protein YdjX (TVP38/TMEM64 family)